MGDWVFFLGLIIAGLGWAYSQYREGQAKQQKRQQASSGDGPNAAEMQARREQLAEARREALRKRIEAAQGGGAPPGQASPPPASAPGPPQAGGANPGNLSMAERVRRARAEAAYRARQAEMRTSQDVPRVRGRQPTTNVPKQAGRPLPSSQRPAPQARQPQPAPRRPAPAPTPRPASQAPPRRAPAEPTPLPARQLRPEGQRRRPVRRPAAQTESAKQVAARRRAASGAPGSSPIEAKPVSGRGLLGPLDRTALRRAVVLQEVLGPPVALRQDQNAGVG